MSEIYSNAVYSCKRYHLRCYTCNNRPPRLTTLITKNHIKSGFILHTEELVTMKRILTILIAVLIFTYVPLNADIELTAENTVVISNETDESFCRDFSIILKRLSLEWIVIESEIPEYVTDKNMIIIGGPNAEYTGDIVKRVLSWSEERYLRKNQYAVFEKENPWADNRVVYVCAGSDRLLTKRAAEEGISYIMQNVQDPEKWIVYPFDKWSSQKAQTYVETLQFIPDEELPKDDLEIDIEAEIPEYISLKEAQEDTEYLFYLLSHGYSGYEYFRTKGDFDQAKNNILEKLKANPVWSTQDFSQVIYDHLSFVHDGHFRVGYHWYHTHEDFWYNASHELEKTGGEYTFTADEAVWTVVTVNGQSPEEFVFPSLNARGKPVYILGVLSQYPPEPVILEATSGYEQKKLEIQFYRSDFTSEDIFSEDDYNGIPVVTMRTFFVTYTDELEQFLETAEPYKEEKYLILDIRGNEGGHSYWGETWVTTFTGEKPHWYFTFTELVSRTTLMGNINLFLTFSERNPKVDIFKTRLKYFEEEMDSFEMEPVPHWGSLYIPDLQLIPNTTTVIVLTDKDVMSAGEAFIGYLRQMENVIFVGENTYGGITFLPFTLHQLPHSKFPAHLACSLHVPADLEIIEERGFYPDLWVPADKALGYVVEAVETGTISAQVPLESLPAPSAGCGTILVIAVIVLYSILRKSGQ